MYRGKPVDLIANTVYLFLDEYYRTGTVSADSIPSFIKLIDKSRTNFYSRLDLYISNRATHYSIDIFNVYCQPI